MSPDAATGSDVLKTLKKEHDEVKSLLGDLEKSPQRRALVQKIKRALTPHTKAEEKVVYQAVIALREKEAQVDGYEGYLGHERAGKKLARLDGIADATSSEHIATAKVLKELVEHYIEEEDNIWSDVKKHFSEDDRVRMTAAFERAKMQIKVA